MKQAPELTERMDVKLSPSVSSVIGRFSDHEAVSAAALAQAVLELHRSDYGGGKASNLALDRTGAAADKRPAQAWMEEIRALFDASLAPELHGRLVIIGLSLLDLRLRRQLQQDGFLAALMQELKEPLDELLTGKGRGLRKPADSVPNQPDDPLQDIAEDQLGRAAFARYLARRIFAIPTSNCGAYSLHLYGPWGSGKSTVLNFLRTHLLQEPKQGVDQPQAKEQPQPKPDEQQEPLKPKDQEWLVVTFNAWQHQHIQPPWWALMEHVFRQSEGELKRRDRLRE